MYDQAMNRASICQDRDFDAFNCVLLDMARQRTLDALLELIVSQLRDLEDIEQVALTPWVPLFSQGGRDRIGAVLSDRIPIVFTWKDSGDPTIISNSMAEAVELKIDNSLPLVPMTINTSRRIQLRPVVLPSVQVGMHRLEDVEALLLAPEDEDLGAQIGPEALGSLQASLQPARLRLLLERR